MVARTPITSNLTKNGVDLSLVKLPRLEVLDPFDIEPLKDQIRKQFLGINELAASIAAAGQATPVIVRDLGSKSKFPFGLVDGERRLRSCRQLKRGIIAVIHDGSMDLEDVHALSVAANFGRQKHDAMEIAKAIRRFRKTKKKWREIKDIFGKSMGWVAQHYRLLQLHPQIQAWLVPGAEMPSDKTNGNQNGKKGEAENASLGSRKIRTRLNFSLALQLLALPKRQQLKLATLIVEKGMSLAEARRAILKQARKQPGFVSNTLPNEWRASICSMAKNIATSVGIYNDMPGDEFKRIFNGVPWTEVEKIYGLLEKADEEVANLVRGLRRFLGK